MTATVPRRASAVHAARDFSAAGVEALIGWPVVAEITCAFGLMRTPPIVVDLRAAFDAVERSLLEREAVVELQNAVEVLVVVGLDVLR